MERDDNIKIIDMQADMLDALNDRVEELEDELAKTNLSTGAKVAGCFKKVLIGLAVLLFLLAFATFICALINAYVKIFFLTIGAALIILFCHFIGDLTLFLCDNLAEGKDGKKS